MEFEFVDLQVLVTVDNHVNYYVTLGDFQRWLQGEK